MNGPVRSSLILDPAEPAAGAAPAGGPGMVLDAMGGAASPMRRGQLTWLSFTRMSLDPAIALLGYVAVTLLRGDPFEGKDLILCLIVFSFMFPGQVPIGRVRSGLFRELLADWGMVVTIVALFGVVTGYAAYFPAESIWTWIAAVPALQYLVHRMIPLLAPRLLAMEGVRTAVVVGANESGTRLAEQFRSKPLLGVKFCGFFDDRALERLDAEAAAAVRGRLADLPDFVRRNGVSAIFISLPMAAQPRVVQLLESLYDTTASVYFVPHLFVGEAIQARIDDIDGLPVVAVCESPFLGVASLVKRIEDLVLAGLILVLAAPLLAAIAVGVKLSSPGPVLFRQRRYGLDGREIMVYKFRSMRVMEDGGVIRQASREDPRVTRFGAFLRRTSLDELPQLINVVQGRMSLVGPRPHAVAHNELYRTLIRGYMIRHKVKPGITGLAQVNGLRGETETPEKMRERVRYDLEYLRHWSLQLDLSIIIRTLIVVVSGRNAY